jgi:hypothetical protein
VSLSTGQIYLLAFLVLLVFIVGRRTVLMVRGTTVSAARLAGFAVFYVVFFVIALAGSLSTVPLYWYGVDAAAVVLAALVAIPYVERVVRIERRPDGLWYYRLGLALPLVYLALFAVRLAVDAFVLDVNPFGPPTAVSLSPFATDVLIAVDVLFGVSTGLLVGRSIGVYRAYRRAAMGAPPLPAGSVD